MSLVKLLVFAVSLLSIVHWSISLLICSNNCGYNQSGRFVKLTVQTSPDTRIKNYQGLVPWLPQMTVHLAMKILAHNNPTAFNFTSKFYVPYGDFIRSINGIMPEKHQHWKLCVNDNMAMCGIDTYRLSEADEIIWKLANIKDEPSGDDLKC